MLRPAVDSLRVLCATVGSFAVLGLALQPAWLCGGEALVSSKALLGADARGGAFCALG